MGKTAKEKKYRFGISFQGDQRRLAKNIAESLANQVGKSRVFFDEWHINEFLGEDGKKALTDVFSKQCDIVVPVFSRKYQESSWCGIEWDSIQLVIGKSGVSVIPVCRDLKPVKGWPDERLAIIYGDKGAKTGKQVANTLLEKSKHLETASPIKQLRKPKKKTKAKGSRSVKPKTGQYIVVADVSNFSALPSSEVKDVIDQLWRIPDRLGTLNSRNSKRIPILDGMILVAKDVRPVQIIEFCERWCAELPKATAEFGTEVRLRIAIHKGDYYFLKDQNCIVGGDVNECSRLVRMAGAGQIVLSEDFVRACEKDGLGVKADLLWPKLTDKRGNRVDPFGFEIKPGTQSYLRYYRDHELPRSALMLRNAHESEQVIYRVLAEIEDEFEDLVFTECPQLKSEKQKLKTRVSIFVIDRNPRDEVRLVSTKFRFMKRARNGNKLLAKNSTAYAIDREEPQGTIGRAFITKQPVVLHKLPKFSSRNTNYLDALGTKAGWNLDAATVDGFSRKARTFLAVPYWLNRGAENADGVICIDSMLPLDDISEEFLLDCAEGFGRFFGTLVAALMRLRS